MQSDAETSAGPKAPQPLVWTPELVGRFWNGIAQTPMTECSFSRTGGMSLLAIIDHLLDPSMRILDFGAGDGRIVLAMCQRGLQAAAYEPATERMLALQAQLEGTPGFLGVIGARDEARFDVVTMTEVIEHILDDDLDACLRRVASLVESGGVLVVTTPNNEDLARSMVYCPVSNLTFHRWQHVRSFTAESLAQLLAKYGFRGRVIHQLDFAEELFNPYDRVWGKEVPEEQWPTYLRDLRANRPVRLGGQSNLLYVGIRIGDPFP